MLGKHAAHREQSILQFLKDEPLSHETAIASELDWDFSTYPTVLTALNDLLTEGLIKYRLDTSLRPPHQHLNDKLYFITKKGEKALASLGD